MYVAPPQPRAGVYLWRCRATCRVYIGSSRNIANRHQYHLAALARGGHINELLQETWNRFGQQAFLFEVLEYCSNYHEREDFWIKLFHADDPIWGFNIYGTSRSSKSDTDADTDDELAADAEPVNIADYGRAAEPAQPDQILGVRLPSWLNDL